MTDYLELYMEERETRFFPALSLAYIGDGVFELLCRSRALMHGSKKIGDLNHKTIEMVRAPMQAKAARVLLEHLTEHERAVYMRARNAKIRAVPKSATYGEYSAATALEALFGYLFLTGQKSRISELFYTICEADDTSQDTLEG